MKINSCLHIIKKYSVHQVGQVSITTISNIQPIPSEGQYIQPNILYFGSLSQLTQAKYLEKYPKLLLLLVQDCEYTYPEHFITSNAVFELESQAALSACVTELLSYFQVETNVLETSTNFFNQLLMLQNLSKVIDVSAAYFRIPLIVGSPGGRKVLAISKTVTGEPDDMLWNSIFQSHEFSVEQHCYDMQHNYGKDFKTNTPYFVHYPSTDKWRIMSKIYSGDHYLGLLHTYDVPFDKIKNIDVNMFQCLSSIIAHFIQVSGLTNSLQHMNKNNFLISLLGDILDSSVKREEVYIDDFPFDEIQLINFPLGKYRYNLNKDGYLINLFRNLFIHSISFYYRRNVILLLNVKKDGNLFHEKKEYLAKELKKNHIIGIVSDLFSDINNLKPHYEQTERILKIVQSLQIEDLIIHCNDYKFLDMALLSCPPDHPETLYQFCNTKLLEIRFSSLPNSHELYQTLREYVFSNKSLSQTSEKLFLHKSTVAYRIRQIKELYNIEFENFQEIFSFYYSFLLMDLIDTFKEKKDGY